MRTTAIATALGVAATLLTTTLTTTLLTAGPSGAATGYDARARAAGDRTCTRTPAMGVTQRRFVLDNSRSTHRVQFKVVREGDRYADAVTYVWVGAHRRKSVTVSVPQRRTASLRVRVPEMGRQDLRLSTTVASLETCYVPTVDPKASLGGVSCHGSDSVAQIVLDNRSTSDRRIHYTVTSSYGDSSASLMVRPASATNYYLPVPAGRSTHVGVAAAGDRVLSIDVAAGSCSS